MSNQDYPRYSGDEPTQYSEEPTRSFEDPTRTFGEQPRPVDSPTPTPYYGAPEPTRYQLQPGYPDQQPAYGVLRDNSNATVSLVLGLIGLCTFILIASPFAWWKAHQALREIDENPGVYNNRGMAVGGQITGIIGTIFLILFLIGGAILAFFLIAAATTN
jgi:hypothetical protein